MSAALAHHWWIAPDEYLEGEELAATRHEYVGGVVYAMAGATNGHNIIAGNIYGELHATLRGHRCQPFNSDTKVRIRQGSDVRFYYPDVMVVCEPNKLDEVFQDRPIAIFEVLSESTARADREEKLRAYQTIPSLRFYAIVESDRIGVACYSRAGEDTSWTSEWVDQPGRGLTLPGLGNTLALESLYARASF